MFQEKLHACCRGCFAETLDTYSGCTPTRAHLSPLGPLLLLCMLPHCNGAYVPLGLRPRPPLAQPLGQRVLAAKLKKSDARMLPSKRVAWFTKWNESFWKMIAYTFLTCELQIARPSAWHSMRAS